MVSLVSFNVVLHYIVLIFAFVAAIFSKMSFFAYIVPVFLLFALSVMIPLIPAELNWSKRLYSGILVKIILYQTVSLICYAIIYFINREDFVGIRDFEDAIYFSITTWTTLGYGEITPPDGLKLITSFEALNGLITIPVFGAFVWKYCSDRFQNYSADEVYERGFSVRLCDDGLFKDLSVERIDEFKKYVSRKVKLHNCCECGSDDVEMVRGYKIIGFLHPCAVYFVRCNSCHLFTKQKVDIYRAAMEWNSKNKN